MRVSWKWLSELVDLKSVGGPQGLAELLTRRGLEVEEIHSMAHGFDKVVSAKILERNPHPQADRLSLCKVTTGAGDPLEIVCGAQNMKAGDTVALAQIGADLPNGLKIALSKIRGSTSHGMLCSEEELKLKEKSEGILILPAGTPLGKPLAEILGRDDTVLTLKLTANRGDCLSHYGIAREVASALGQKPKRPEGLAFDPAQGGSPISIHLEAGESCPQFWGIYVEGVKIGPSPAWVAKRLEALGSRSINNVVDASNLVMLELGHPLHAYDADKIEGKRISARVAREGEELPLLDGSTVKLGGFELVIADGKRAVGLAGVMGGGNSEVQDGTTRLFLEAAEFAPALVRRAASKHQKHSDAAHRFERGVNPDGVGYALGRLAKLVTEWAGGAVKGSTVAHLPSRDPKKGVARQAIPVPASYFNEFLGIDSTLDEVEKVLKAHDCEVQRSGQGAAQSLAVTPPAYRLDLSIPEDLAEEIARSVGYERIPSTIPALTSAPTSRAIDPSYARLIVQDRAKDALVQAGLEETINLSFTSKTWLEQFGLFEEGRTVKVLNPLSEDHEFMLPSLLPGLVRNSLDGWRHHFGSEPLPIRLFELRPTFAVPAGQAIAAKGEAETGAEERWKLGIALSGPRNAGGLRLEMGEVDFYDLKAVVESLFESLGTKGIRFQPLFQSRTPGGRLAALFHPGQSVEILAGNTVAGVMGLFHPGKAKELKARAPLWVAELDWEAVSKLSRGAGEARAFKPWSEFPPMERDFALLVKKEVTADKITQLALKAGKPLAKVAKVFDIYRGSQVAEGMTSVAVRVIFFDEARSLQENETESASAQILEAWKKELGVELRS